MVIVTKRENGSRRVQLKVTGKSRTEQSHKKQVNINTIVAKAFRTGLFPTRKDIPTYGDFSIAEDFHSATNRIKEANKQFMMLPSEIRGRFKNNPANLIGFLAEPDNRTEAIELGLIPKPVEVAIVPPPAPVELEKDLENLSEEIPKTE